MELVCRTAWEMRQATLCVFLQCVSEQLNSGRKGALSEKWENFLFSWNFYTFPKHVFWWFCAKVVLSQMTAGKLHLLKSDKCHIFLSYFTLDRRHTCMHACIDTYIHTHTHLTADKQTHMHAYTHTGQGDDWFFTSQKARKLACFAWILFVVSLQLNHVSRWIPLKITLHQNMSILGLSWCLA